MAEKRNEPAPETLAAQAMHYLDRETGAVVPPIHTSTTYARNEAYEPTGGYTYSRDRNPTEAPLEALLAKLDGGADARVFASGLAAVAAVLETVPAGRHVVAPRVMYHGALAWLRRISERRGIGLTLFEPTDPAALKQAVRPGETDLVWIETLLNPTWDVIDVAAAAEAAHGAGAQLAVDATVSPPPTTRPLALGADIVFHSATKYLNGHSDVTAGVLVTRADDARWRDILEIRTHAGAVPGPFESWLLLRGLRTLYVRYARCSETALSFARHFERHPKLEAVRYAGLESHPGHAIAKAQMTGGFGGMLSILVRGDAATAKRVATACRLFLPATSLGGVESLIEHRATVQGTAAPVAETLLRLSIGLESADDLIADLEQALEAVP